MTKETTLKSFCKDFLQEVLTDCNKISLENPVLKKQETQFSFKNNLFDDESKILKKDYLEFFSRNDVIKLIKNNENFTFMLDVLATYNNIKKLYSERHIEVEKLVFYFIENYVIETDEFSFDKVEFEKLFKRFVAFLDSDILEVYYFTPLYNFSYSDKHEKKNFGDIILKRITSKQFKIIKESLVGKRMDTPGQMYKLGYVLETTVPFKNNLEKEDKLANNKFNNFLNTALLFQTGDLKIGSLYRNYTEWTSQSSKSSQFDNMQLGNRIFEVKKTGMSNLKKFYEEYSKIKLDSKEWSFIKVAIDRFRSSILRNEPIDKIVDLNVALECLFSSPMETSFKFANRISAILGTYDEQREYYWNFIKNEYKLRNDILHGRKADDININDELIQLEEIARNSIRKFLNLAKVSGIDEVWSIIKEHEGEKFETIKGEPFTYKADDKGIITSRTDFKLSKSDVEKVLGRVPLKGPGEITNDVRGPSYIWAILHDERIFNNQLNAEKIPKEKKGKEVREYILDELDIGLINRTKLEEFSSKTLGTF